MKRKPKSLYKLKNEILYRFSEFKRNIKDFKTGVINIFQWIPVIYKDRNFDDGYLLRIEYEKLKKMYNYFKDADIVVDEWHIALTIKRAISLLEIILEDDGPYNKYLNDNYGEDIFTCVETGDPDIYELKPIDRNRKLKVPVKVNTRNAYRFAYRTYKDEEESKLEKNLRDNYGLWAMELRKLKAMHIYYEMRKNYTYEWWD